jgi:hypothetical protein
MKHVAANVAAPDAERKAELVPSNFRVVLNSVRAGARAGNANKKRTWRREQIGYNPRYRPFDASFDK